jgi:glycosyltransferase involved in cell wall biosynthesis
VKSIGILWAQYGPYHFARVAALKQQAGPGKVHALELASQTSTYEWKRSATADLITLCPGAVADRLSFWQVFHCVRRKFAELKLEVCLLPSYAPKQSFAALLAAKSLGIRTVMMNESHAGTARAAGLAALVKRQLVGLFDAALVGGAPQKRYFNALGLAEEKIFIGYDAVDNDYFAAKSEELRSRESEIRSRYGLPEHYFLSLGRFVAKKNLPVLIRAYRKCLDSDRSCQTHLVMVGSGAEEPKLRALCQELKLSIYDKTAVESGTRNAERGNEPPGVHFYGFRQIEENPVFYALADAFVLPSLREEWGLVVNEAMASGLPVVVSKTAGCAEDLLKLGRLPVPVHLSANLNSRLSRLAGRIRQNGFVFNPKSVESLADALILLAAVPGIRQQMGKASRIIVENFSCDVFAQNALLAARVAMGEDVSVPRSALPKDEPMDLVSKLIP